MSELQSAGTAVRLAFFIEHQEVFNEHAFSKEVIIVYFMYLNK